MMPATTRNSVLLPQPDVPAARARYLNEVEGLENPPQKHIILLGDGDASAQARRWRAGTPIQTASASTSRSGLGPLMAGPTSCICSSSVRWLATGRWTTTRHSIAPSCARRGVL